MLTILTTISHWQDVKNAIASVDRLDELVSIVTNADDVQPSSKWIIVDNNITLPTLYRMDVRTLQILLKKLTVILVSAVVAYSTKLAVEVQ